MSVKHYGIYLAYGPTVDVRHEGLGRYLAAFLKGASTRSDVRFVLVCPSWAMKALEDLFTSEKLSKDNFDIFFPIAKPLMLRVYEAYQGRKTRPHKPALLQRFISRLRPMIDAYVARNVTRLARAYSFSSLIPVIGSIGLLAVIAVLLSPMVITVGIVFVLGAFLTRSLHRLSKLLLRLKSRLQQAFDLPKIDGFITHLYRQMEAAESERMLGLIQELRHVRAWYSPTAFWPAFNNIRAPRLMCVPDVVLKDFPIGFSEIGGNHLLSAFGEVESAIRSGQHFVTYSNAVKWETLVGHYGVRSANVAVIHHAPNDLSPWVTVHGFNDVVATSRHYCEWLLSCAFKRSSNLAYTSRFSNTSVKFLFYASQFRPNKNVISLLRAYEYLLRNRFIGHKLILTGDPKLSGTVQKFISEHFLENEVLCLHGLKIQELAACYKLADLAVNPSFSEGGCPFTFTEALSVDTPVVMARISVTEEVLTDPELQNMTFFDPYDWQDMAHRIEWALSNLEELLVIQRRTYATLAQRSWTDVVNEHIDALEKIANSADVGKVLHAA